MCLVCFTSRSTHSGMGGIGVAPCLVLVVTKVAECRGKDHRGNQEGIGYGRYQHKDETDDAEMFGLLQFAVLLFAEGLCEEEGEVCVCAHVRARARVCVCVRALLTIILMTVAGTRQRSPGSQKSTVKMIVATTLVTKAYLGSLVSVGLASVCCVATMGI